MIGFLAAVSAVLATPSCAHLDSGKIDQLADNVESALINPTINPTEAAVRLNLYWDGVCIGERRNAPRSIVITLSKLLWVRDARFLIASDLVEVDRNLMAAKPYVEAAAADEKLRYEELAKTNAVVLNATAHYDAVRCVERKIKTGTLDARYCRGTLAASHH
ncbi:MAG: hypothetical protein ACJ8FO_09975 [Sphingomicrobium sp.]